jgi:hypothetical protein
MRRLFPLLAVAVMAALLAGCASSEETTSAAPAVSTKQQARATWLAEPDCRHPEGAARWGCSVGSYRCQAVVTGRGWSVSCAKPGKSIAFRVRPS